MTESEKNTQEYYDVWERCLLKNGHTKEAAQNGAIFLCEVRSRDIKRGRPDIPHALEQSIWTEAFQIHSNRNHIRSGLITPKWADSSSAEMCDCFDVAFEQYKIDSRPKIVLELDPFSHYFEPRIG